MSFFGLFRRRKPAGERLTAAYLGRGWAQPHTIGGPVQVPARTVKKLGLVTGDRIEFEVGEDGKADAVTCYARTTLPGAQRAAE